MNNLKELVNCFRYIKKNGTIYYYDTVDKKGNVVLCSWSFKPNWKQNYYDVNGKPITDNYYERKI